MIKSKQSNQNLFNTLHEHGITDSPSPTVHRTVHLSSSFSAICEREKGRGRRRLSPEEIVRRPEAVEWTRPFRIEAEPRLPLPAPVQEADRPRMQIPAKPVEVVAAETVLIPAVLDPPHVAGEDQEEWRKRTQLVYPHPLLDPHPRLQLLRVAALPPPLDVDHHHPRVEVARPPPLKRPEKTRVRPELAGEVAGEVGVAVFRRSENVGAEIDGPELGDVVDDDQVRVEVDDPSDPSWEEIRQVDPGVVEGLVEGSSDGGGDLPLDEAGVEVVEAEIEVGEGGDDGAAELGAAVGGEEVEDDVLRAGGMLEDGEDAGD